MIVAVMMMLVCVQVIECTGEESTLEALPGESWDRWVAIGVSGCRRRRARLQTDAARSDKL